MESTDGTVRTSASRIAIVTGVGSGIGGIGRGIALDLLRQGYAVLAADRDAAVQDVVRDLARQAGGGADCLGYAGDLSRPDEARAMAEAALSRWGRIDVLVNNAGSGVIRPFLEHDEASLVATLERNLWTALWCCHAVLPAMVRQNHGRIVNIGADSLRTGIPGHAGYNAAKGGVVGLMVGLAREFAAYDITVNTVSPCVVNTERHRQALRDDSELARAFLQVVPKGRGVEIEEICDFVTFLARRENAFATGQDFSLNGGSAMP
ncbi:SDR family oxidoreductase [Verticiella sediminum]|uniref:SDR family oxidoreductase n=1 Tax=Verticiella sediminum TaxID=1247510 RepID=A0A556ANR8_9BURK|nr:SDR family oxidoreductase [Verticiella sediminum]TSH94521.1 SDR family oxidoreductase [Verticiella sediminum]